MLDPLFVHSCKAPRECDLSYPEVRIERPCLSWSQSALVRKRRHHCGYLLSRKTSLLRNLNRKRYSKVITWNITGEKIWALKFDELSAFCFLDMLSDLYSERIRVFVIRSVGSYDYRLIQELTNHASMINYDMTGLYLVYYHRSFENIYRSNIQFPPCKYQCHAAFHFHKVCFL